MLGSLMVPPYRPRPARPLTARDKRVLLLASLVVLLAGAAAGLWGALNAGSWSSSGRCVTLVVASSTGGDTIHHCGASARSWCQAQFTSHDQLAERARPACRSAGFAPEGGNGSGKTTASS